MKTSKTKLTVADQDYIKRNTDKSVDELAKDTNTTSEVVQTFLNSVNDFKVKPKYTKGATIMTAAASAEGDKVMVDSNGKLVPKINKSNDERIKEYKQRRAERICQTKR
jgi:hypothetical protein